MWKPLSLGQLELMHIFRSVSITKTNYLTVYHCSLANDGTAIKPAIEFDVRLKQNVRLTFILDIDYIRNPKPSADFLSEVRYSRISIFQKFSYTFLAVFSHNLMIYHF